MMSRDLIKKEIIEKASNQRKMSKIIRLYEPLWNGIEEALSLKQTLIISIDGHSTSGKSTLADLIEKLFDAQIFHIDDFFRSIKQGESQLDYASNIDFERFEREVSTPLLNHQNVEYRAFNCKMQNYMPSMSKTFKKLTVIEGAYSTHPYISNIMDIKVFLKSTYLKQLIKVVKRNGIKHLRVFIKKWIPKERAYFKQYRVEQNADYVFRSL